MKDKILIFVIGLLVGVAIATGAFYIYTQINSNNNTTQNNEQINSEKPEMNGEEPPEKPTGENSEQSEKSSASKHSKKATEVTADN